jgi:hypothetical protein
MGTLLVETGLPTLNIIDAVWVNAHPGPSESAGPETPYAWATRVNVLVASTDPVALDYWVSKHVLMQTAEAIGYASEEMQTLNPEASVSRGFGRWLNLTLDEIATAGYNVTIDSKRMNVYVEDSIVHDIAIIGAFQSHIGAVIGEIISINTTLENQGDFSEVFNVTTFWDFNPIETQEALLSIDSMTTLSFEWNTSGVNSGNYTLWVNASFLPEEIETDDNTLVIGIVTLEEPVHDVSIVSVGTSKTAVGLGGAANITVVVGNQDLSKTFNVTIFANSSEIMRVEVTLFHEEIKELTLRWIPVDLEKGNYTLSGFASPVPGENDTINNLFVNGPIMVTVLGDVEGDRDVDIFDIVILVDAYGANKGDPKYAPNCDLDGDGDIDIFDIVVAAGNYGYEW